MMISLQDLLKLCHLPLLASSILLPPREPSITSENFKHILTWEEPNNESAIYYNVEYQTNYIAFCPVANCSNITTPHCDLTKVFSNIWNRYKVRVQSFTSTESSEPSLTPDDFKPLRDTHVGPPIVNVVAADTGINVSISLPFSFLWNSEDQRFDSILIAYPCIDYEIFLEPSTEVPIYVEAVSVESFTKNISFLNASTIYCVIVSMNSENIHRSIPSPKKCITTNAAQVEGDKTVYWIVAGVILFIMLPVLLMSLDQAGYISKKKTSSPKVLESLPDSRSLLHEPDQLTPLTPTLPVELIHILGNEYINECPARIMGSSPYIAHNVNAENEDHQEALDQGEGLSSNRATTRENSAAPFPDLTELVLSEGPSVQALMSICDNISSKHPAVISLSERRMEAPSEDIVGSTENLLSHQPNGFGDSLNLSKHLSIDLNSISLGDSSDLWTSVPKVTSPQESSNVLASHPNRDVVTIGQVSLLRSVLSADATAMDHLDCENNTDEDEGIDLNCASDYIRR